MIIFALMVSEVFADFSQTFEYLAAPESQNELIWEMEKTDPYNELIVSWNGRRPQQGKWTLYVSLFQTEWSPWLKYAEWTPSTQKTFKSSPPDTFAETYQDAANPKTGFCNGFRVKMTAEEGADLLQLDSLYACLSNLQAHAIVSPGPLLPIVLQGVPRQSQMVLDHPRHKDMCSPTSTSTAIRYLSRKEIHPVLFASHSHDDEFDIYGNWILNTAEAYQELDGAYRVHVERLNDFTHLHAHLCRGNPVVVSVKGPLPGAPKPYNSGHLICIIGYDPTENKVICVDSAFPDNESTLTAYPLPDFLNAWALRRNIAYIFEKK